MTELLPQHTNAKILLIDDDPANNSLIEKILLNFGFKRIRSITDPRLAAYTIREYGPNLILLDLDMPYMDGFEVIRRYQVLNRNDMLPVIVITVKNEQENKIKALTLGVQYFSEKPVDQFELLTRVQNVLHIGQLHNETSQIGTTLEKEKQRVNRLERSAIESLLSSIYFRDPDAGDHVCSISDLVRVLSEGMNLPEAVTEKLALASKLHDIGKIGIPDSILLKKGKLSPAERKIMETHTLMGEKILSVETSEVLTLAGVIARTHHENWDGTGYPYGLAQKRIPLAGRLTAIADVFDALLADRPYKKAWDFDAAVNYIQEESGTKFDPALVCVFIRNVDRVRQIYSGPKCEKTGR